VDLRYNNIIHPIIVLAGGFGTRLQSVLNGLPKPLADINGVPFLNILFSNWIEQGFSRFILSLHYESEKIINHVEILKKSILIDCKVDYVIEESPLGTGGAISYVVKELNLEGDFFVVNADTWIETGYSEMNAVEGNLIGVVHIENTGRYGTVLLDEFQRIIKFEEKNLNNNSGIINAGVYRLNSSLFSDWDGSSFSIEKDTFPNLIQNKGLIGIELNTNFIDIGIPEDYLKFCRLRDL
jgi:D-glycero-alpha-D-manno-heptose 1-phosphate guanylyltransferase